MAGDKILLHRRRAIDFRLPLLIAATLALGACAEDDEPDVLLIAIGPNTDAKSEAPSVGMGEASAEGMSETLPMATTHRRRHPMAHR